MHLIRRDHTALPDAADTAVLKITAQKIYLFYIEIRHRVLMFSSDCSMSASR